MMYVARIQALTPLGQRFQDHQITVTVWARDWVAAMLHAYIVAQRHSGHVLSVEAL